MVLSVFAFALTLAGFNERFNEVFIKPLVPSKYRLHAALITGLLIVAILNVDFVTPLLDQASINPLADWAGLLISGISVGAGSNFLHDIWPGELEAS